jgi:hypothetical protein
MTSRYIEIYQAACTVAGRGHSCSACIDQQRGRTCVLAAVGWRCRAGRRRKAANNTLAALLCQRSKVKRYMSGPRDANRVCHNCCSCKGVCRRAAATGQPAFVLAKFVSPLHVVAHASASKIDVLQNALPSVHHKQGCDLSLSTARAMYRCSKHGVAVHTALPAAYNEP